MSRRIFKYPVPVEDSFDVRMPRRAEVLTVQTQEGKPQMWALVQDEEPPDTLRRFHVRGTGLKFTGEEGKYIGTFQLGAGGLVFHLFEDTHQIFEATS